jgi:hypothetical protein
MAGGTALGRSPVTAIGRSLERPTGAAGSVATPCNSVRSNEDE